MPFCHTKCTSMYSLWETIGLCHSWFYFGCKTRQKTEQCVLLWVVKLPRKAQLCWPLTIMTLLCATFQRFWKVRLGLGSTCFIQINDSVTFYVFVSIHYEIFKHILLLQFHLCTFWIQDFCLWWSFTCSTTMIRDHNRQHISASPIQHRACHQSANLSLAFPTTMKNPLKTKLNMRSLPCSGTNILQHQFQLSLQAWAVTRNHHEKKKAQVGLPNKAVACSGFSRQACGVIISGHRSGQVMRPMCPERSVRHKS